MSSSAASSSTAGLVVCGGGQAGAEELGAGTNAATSSPTPGSWSSCSPGGLRAWALEVIGPDPEQADELSTRPRRVAGFRALSAPAGEGWLPPHTPHTVSARCCGAGAGADGGSALAIHVAESSAEAELSLHGTGPLAAAGSGRRGCCGANVLVRYLHDLGVWRALPPCTWQVSETTCACRARQPVVVHCPRSNEALAGVSRGSFRQHPWKWRSAPPPRFEPRPDVTAEVATARAARAAANRALVHGRRAATRRWG